MNEKSIENLLRFIGATNYTQLLFNSSKEMFDRSWYKLGIEERQSVTNAVNQQLIVNSNGLTAELLMAWLNQVPPVNPIGFQPQQVVPSEQKPNSQSRKK